MSTDYGSATIANAPALAGVYPSGTPAVQPPIGHNALTAANTEMWNDHLGSKLAQPAGAIGAAAAGGVPLDGSSLIAAPGTLGRDKAGNLITWSTCVAGCAAGATGTLTGSTFVVGAGSAVAQAAIPANGYGWVKN